MLIEWSIVKKSGNFRPVLRYALRLTEFEKSLAVPPVRLQTGIPKPPEPGLSYCWPGRNERGQWTPQEHYVLMSPPHIAPECEESVKLPWRENNAYPEVEEAFLGLRAVFEEALALTAASQAMRMEGRLDGRGQISYRPASGRKPHQAGPRPFGGLTGATGRRPDRRPARRRRCRPRGNRR